MTTIAAERRTSPVAYRDLREWLQAADALGELKGVRGVHWDREMGAMVDMCYRRASRRAPALLFDDVPGYPPGYRCLYGMMASPRRFALTIGGLTWWRFSTAGRPAPGGATTRPRRPVRAA